MAITAAKAPARARSLSGAPTPPLSLERPIQPHFHKQRSSPFESEGERERERKREKERETGRQTDRQTERMRERPYGSFQHSISLSAAAAAQGRDERKREKERERERDAAAAQGAPAVVAKGSATAVARNAAAGTPAAHLAQARGGPSPGPGVSAGPPPLALSLARAALAALISIACSRGHGGGGRVGGRASCTADGRARRIGPPQGTATRNGAEWRAACQLTWPYYLARQPGCGAGWVGGLRGLGGGCREKDSEEAFAQAHAEGGTCAPK